MAPVTECKFCKCPISPEEAKRLKTLPEDDLISGICQVCHDEAFRSGHEDDEGLGEEE